VALTVRIAEQRGVRAIGRKNRSFTCAAAIRQRYAASSQSGVT
jgi:hypothetical protein